MLRKGLAGFPVAASGGQGGVSFFIKFLPTNGKASPILGS
jgi:hypothetical protein